MKPGDILLWRDEKFGVHRAWKVLSVLLGGEKSESLIEMQAMFETPGHDVTGKPVPTVLVPEVLTRGLTIFNSDGISTAAQ